MWKFYIKQYLPFLSHIENPNGEDLKTIERYNQIFLEMYADPERVGIDSCYEMWKEFGIEDELAEKVKLQAEEYRHNKMVIDVILRIYPEMLIRAKI